MKKIIIRVAVVFVVLLIVGVVAVGFFLGDIVKAGMNTVGPKITQTTFVVNSVSISMLTGSAGVKGLVIGNPEGYRSPSAISVGKAAVSVAPLSILSDKIVVKSVEVRDAEITFEGNPLGANNLKKLMDNVNAIAGASAAPATNAPAKTGQEKPAKKLQVDDFLITGAKVQFNGVTLPLPPIHLSNLGAGSDGITPAALVKEVLGQVTTATLKAVGESLTKLGKVAVDAGKDAGKAIGGEASKIGKTLGGLFGK
ncbi:MAG: hypothetical protein WCH99_19560 [Verrucomicrobiota bacterium]